MTDAPGPEAIGVSRLELNFERLDWRATTIRKTNTRLATSGDRKHSPAASALENDDELPPGAISVYVVKMSRAFRKPVNAMRLGNTPQQTTNGR
jgi:hypothetical protein